MTVSASDVQVGKCYVTGYSQVRRVVEVGKFEVKYEPVGRDRPAGSSEPYISVSREKFAAEVDREVGCPE